MNFKVIMETTDPAEAAKLISLLPGGTPLGTKPIDETKLEDPPPPSSLVMNHLDRITDQQLKDLFSKKSDEYKAVGKDGYPVIRKIIEEHGEPGKGVSAVHDSRRAALKAAVEALVP